MISAATDANGRRTYSVPQALAAVAMELFPDHDQTSAIFRLAKALTWADCHTTERIALEGSHAEAVSFARERLLKVSRH